MISSIIYIYIYIYIYTGLQKLEGAKGAAAPQIFPKVDLLPIKNDSEKQKVTRKTKTT